MFANFVRSCAVSGAGPLTATDASSRVIGDLDFVSDFEEGDWDGDGGLDVGFCGALSDDWEVDFYIASNLVSGGTLEAERLHIDFREGDWDRPFYFYDVNEDGRDDLAGRYVFLSR